MWFEILPAAGVIFGAMCFGGAMTALIPNTFLGKPGMRRLFHPYEFEYYLRDRQITGSAYDLKGLEGIPDATENQSKTAKK